MVSSTLIAFAQALSRVLGWTYFSCWSFSFYPQPLLNRKRQSTTGLAIDFYTINILGYISYTASNLGFYFSSLIRSQYAARNPISPIPTVRANDVAFAVHALIVSSITYSMFFPQIWGFTVGNRQRLSLQMKAIIAVCLLGIISFVAFVTFETPSHGRDPTSWAWLDVIYGLGYIKLIVTFTKYCPQAWVNYKRKSTDGFSIMPILLDCAGGFLSIAQLVLDSSLQADWSGLTGNPTKLWVGNISLFFDAILITQHYLIYPNFHSTTSSSVSSEYLDDTEQAPLLSAEQSTPSYSSTSSTV